MHEKIKIIEFLNKHKNTSLEDLRNDEKLRYAVERSFQVLIEIVLDISQMIISLENIKRPEEYNEAILKLGKCKVLSKKFAEQFAPIAGFRNILVHKYSEVDLNEIHAHLKDLKDFNTFAKHIAKYLKKK